MRFHEIQHQSRAVSILQRSLASGRTPHAFLLEGPAGVGKKSAARALAAALLCLERESSASAGDALFGDMQPPDTSNACTTCRACELFSADQHPDFQRIYRGLHKHHPDRSVRSSRGLFIGVDVIRHFLLDPANLTPNVSPRRVFLIEQAERMNESAQNALLKTLEEPPGRTNLILVTTSAERLLPTIRSRCQRVSFGLLPPEFVKTELENRTDANGPAADTLARISGGRLGAALHWHAADLLTQLAALADLLIKRDAHDPEGFGKALIAIGDPMAAQLAAAEQEQPEDKDESTAGSDNQRDALKLLFALIAELYRDALLRQTVDSDALLHILTCAAQTEQLATRVADEQCQNAIDAALQAERLLDRNVAAQLVCERLAVALGGAPLAIDQQA